jgi:hypothetical protein
MAFEMREEAISRIHGFLDHEQALKAVDLAG